MSAEAKTMGRYEDAAPVVEEKLKYCSRCRLDRPVGDFQKCSHKKDGLQSWCRSCMRTYGQSVALTTVREFKYCSRCDATKPVAEFWKNRAARDGLQGYCKLCLA